MSAVSAVNNQSLGKDQFLKLFTTQARMQNPMSPMEGSDFLAQLAQFSSVEQLGNLNTSFEKLLSVEQSLQAGGLVGKVIAFQDGTTGDIYEGRVSGVKLSASGPILMIGNREVPMASVTSIREDFSPQETAADAADAASP